MTSNTLRVDTYSSHCTTPSERVEHQAVTVKVCCLRVDPATPMTSNILRMDTYSSHCTTPSERVEHQAVTVKVCCLRVDPATPITSNSLQVTAYSSHCTILSERVEHQVVTVKVCCLHVDLATPMTLNTLRVDEYSSHCTTPSERVEHQAVTVKICCLRVDPATPRGRRLFMLQMLVLCFIPHVALVAQNCTVMAQLSQTLEASLYLHTEVSSILSLGDAVAALQEERLLIFRSLLLNSAENNNRSRTQHAFSVSDALINALPDSVLQEKYKVNLYRFREDFVTTVNLKKADFLHRMSVYGEINTVLLLYLAKDVKTTNSILWRLLSACYELLRGIEQVSLSLLSLHSAGDQQTIYQQHQFAALDHLDSTVLYLKADRIELYEAVEEIYNFYESSFRRKQSHTELDRERFITASDIYLGKLRDVRIKLWAVTRDSLRQEVWAARRTVTVGVSILIAVLLASPVLVLLIRYTVNTLQANVSQREVSHLNYSFNRSIELSTQQLMAEKQKSDLLLSRMLPMPVLRRLRAQRTVPAEAFDSVTIFFSDIVSFTTISSTSTPMEVINMLNMLYRLFDEKIMHYNVYKVETIGDAYMVVSGLPQRNGNRHTSEIADMSLSLMRSLEGATVPHRPDQPLQIRAGVNTGSCVAGVVGTTMPRYCLFGDTINVASRMESTGEAMKIHISDSTKKALDQIGGYEVQSRGIIDVAGKGPMETFWLLRKTGGLHDESPRCLRLRDYDQNLLELLIKS